MFGTIFDLAEGAINGAVNTVDEFIDNPIGKTIDVATQPIRDGIEVVAGLTEGELRVKAALSLGADVVSGMALGEVINWYKG